MNNEVNAHIRFQPKSIDARLSLVRLLLTDLSQLTGK
jgi:hypothetical protein